MKFVTQLKGSAQWEIWLIKLASTLNDMIKKSNPYLLCDTCKSHPNPICTTVQIIWESKSMVSETITSTEFWVEAIIFYQLIWRNIAEELDAYTYVKGEIIRRMKGQISFLSGKNTSMMRQSKKGFTRRIKFYKSLIYKYERTKCFEAFIEIYVNPWTLFKCNWENMMGALLMHFGLMFRHLY